MQLRGATALVTGGGHRLGRAITLALAGAGANVLVNYHRSEEAARATVAEVERIGARALALRADAADPEQFGALLETASRTFPRIDLFVANAGVFRRMPAAALTAADWDEMMRLNFETLLVPARSIALRMLEQGAGCIVAIADVAAIRPWADYVPYCVAKSCVVGLVKNLAVRLAPAIRVNAILPGPVLFPDGFDPAARRREIARTVLRREGSAADIASAVAFLAQADYVTGAVLPVDGGRLLT
jgi:pteridine reductase